MLLGPFGELDIEAVKTILETHKINFEIVISEKGIDSLKDNRANGGRYYQRGPRPIHFEIADEDFAKIAPQMEKYGIVASDSDGSWELGGSDDDYNNQ